MYVGEEYNANTGLYYLRARYMNPTTGSFTTMDSYQGNLYDPISLHKYAYANANPVSYTDPSGYSPLPTLAIGMSISQIISASMHFIKVSTLIGAASGALIGGIDTFLGGGDFGDILKDALKGLGAGAALGLLLSTLMCFAILYPIALVALQACQVILLVYGSIGVIVSIKEGNIAQAVFRALLSLISFKHIKGSKKMIAEASEAASKADLGNKLDYQFGKAGGNKHNVDRTTGLKSEMDKLGFDDTAGNRAYFEQYYNDVLNDSGNIVGKPQEASYVENGVTYKYIVTTRESFLMGKYGGAKVTTYWDGNRLLTIKIGSGKQRRYNH